MPSRKLPRSFYARETLAVARELLGMHLVHVGPPDDRSVASSRPRRTRDRRIWRRTPRAAARARTEVMFGPPGHAYVYLIYGFWNCLNVVTAAEGVAARGVDPRRSSRSRASIGHDAWTGPAVPRAAHRSGTERRGSARRQPVDRTAGPITDTPRIVAQHPHRRRLRRRLGHEAVAVFRPGFALRLDGDRSPPAQGAGCRIAASASFPTSRQ